MLERRAYPTFIVDHEGKFIVFVPDLDLYTEGKDMEDAIFMARDTIGLACIDWEEAGRELPKPSNYEEAIQKAKDNAEVFDYSTGILTMVDVNITEFRKRVRNQAVKKNCTIPYWLSEAAEEAGINFSKVLQEALCQKLKL